MVELQIASRLNADFRITGKPSLAAQDDGILDRQANLLEAVFYQNMPETLYTALVRLMYQRIADQCTCAFMADLTESAGENGVAALLHHADGTREPTILHDYGQNYEDRDEPLSARAMGICREEMDEGDFPPELPWRY